MSTTPCPLWVRPISPINRHVNDLRFHLQITKNHWNPNSLRVRSSTAFLKQLKDEGARGELEGGLKPLLGARGAPVAWLIVARARRKDVTAMRHLGAVPRHVLPRGKNPTDYRIVFCLDSSVAVWYHARERSSNKPSCGAIMSHPSVTPSSGHWGTRVIRPSINGPD
jgi:hypothetical protein